MTNCFFCEELRMSYVNMFAIIIVIIIIIIIIFTIIIIIVNIVFLVKLTQCKSTHVTAIPVRTAPLVAMMLTTFPNTNVSVKTGLLG